MTFLLLKHKTGISIQFNSNNSHLSVFKYEKSGPTTRTFFLILGKEVKGHSQTENGRVELTGIQCCSGMGLNFQTQLNPGDLVKG